MTEPLNSLRPEVNSSSLEDLSTDKNGRAQQKNARISAMSMTKFSTASSLSDFSGLLFDEPVDSELTDNQEKGQSFVSDLNLDLVVDAIVARREESDFLKQHLYRQLHNIRTVRYRHEIFQDLEAGTLFEAVKDFAQKIYQVRAHANQVEKMFYRYQKEGWFLDEVAIYCEAVTTLAADFDACEIHSRGLNAFGDYLFNYVASPEFSSLKAETMDLKNALEAIKYSVRIKGLKVEVRRFLEEDDYSAVVEATFERFNQGSLKDYKVKFRGWPGMNHVGAQILDLVARLFSEEFSALDDYCRRHTGFFDDIIRRTECELQFYIAYLEFIQPLRLTGLEFCYPEVSEKSKEIYAIDTFDVALANKLVPDGVPVICNEFYLKGTERVLVISGPNQGGKTTFARTFGQLHHLASIGCLVPGSAARLFLFDRIFTHFEREEDLDNMSGKLENDLVRIRGVLEEATANSIVIMNEIFTSTTLKDAQFLGTRIMEQFIDLDLLAVYVTFVDEIASLGRTVVSMKSTIAPENPAERTYKVVRGPADGLVYALAIAEKYSLTYERISGRIAR